MTLRLAVTKVNTCYANKSQPKWKLVSVCALLINSNVINAKATIARFEWFFFFFASFVQIDLKVTSKIAKMHKRKRNKQTKSIIHIDILLLSLSLSFQKSPTKRHTFLCSIFFIQKENKKKTFFSSFKSIWYAWMRASGAK